MNKVYLARTALSLALAASIAGPAQAANGLLWRNTSSGATYQFVLDANKVVAEQDSTSLAAPWLPVGQGDFNGDGDDDIFWRNSTTGDNKIQLFKNGVATGFTDYDRIADTGWTLVGTGDLNGDKTTDLVWRHKTTQELYSQLVNNGRIASEKLLFKVPEAAWKVAAVRDFDADGKADLLFRHDGKGYLYLINMNGNQIASEHDMFTVGDLNWQIAGVDDVNGDKKADIVWRNKSSGDNYLVTLNNHTVLAEGDLPKVADLNWKLLQVADLTGDGKAELIWKHATTNEVVSHSISGYQLTSEQTLVRPPMGWDLLFVPKVIRTVSTPVLTQLALSPSSATLEMGQTQTLSVKGTYSDNSNKDLAASSLSWTSVNPAVASVNNGQVQALTAGSSQVCASSGSIKGCADIKINAATSFSIYFKNPSSWAQTTPNLYLWSTGKEPNGAWPGKAMNDASSGWYSTTLSATELDAQGCSELIFNNGAKQTGNLKRCLSEGSGYYDTAWHNGQPSDLAKLTAVSFSETSLKLETGSSQQLSLQGKYDNGSSGSLTAGVSWTVTDTSIASISSSGLVKGLKEGSTQVTASAAGLSATLSLSISKATGINLAFTKPSGWGSTVYLYSWTTGAEPYGKWPGTALTLVDGLYNVAIPTSYFAEAGCTNLIFNDGGTNKTDTLKRCTSEGDATYTNGVWEKPAVTDVVLTVTNGTGAGTYKSGQSITVTANAAPTGLSFVGWKGTAVAYLADAKASSTTLTVPSTSPSLSLIADFDDPMESNRQVYQDNCMACHGVKGEGTAAGIPLTLNIQTRYSLATLTKKIADTMPPKVTVIDSTTTATRLKGCEGDCAAATAAYIWAGLPQKPANYCSIKGTQPEKRRLRLLTNQEYRSSVQNLFGLSDAAAQALALPADQQLSSGYNNDASRQINDSIAANDYLNAAIKATENASLAALSTGCSSDRNCLVKKAGRKIFRRALTDAEVTRLLNLATATSDKQMLASMLISPSFLFRSELGDTQVAGGYQLTDWEIATALSYGLWGSTPDDTLLDLAEQGQLNTAAQIKSQAQRLIADAKAKTQYRNFVSGWLPNYVGPRDGIGASLAEAMTAETPAFVSELAFNNGKVTDLYSANYSYMNSELAQYYGVTGVSGSTLQKVTYGQGDTNERQGVLSHAAFLISHASEASPIPRGVFIRRKLLCQDLPSPVLSVPLVPNTSDPLRTRLEKHTASPTCGACHQYINGIGLGFERFDKLGKYQATANGSPIDQSGTLVDINTSVLNPNVTPSLHDNKTFSNGVKELSNLLGQSNQVQACYVRQYYRYQAGHKEKGADECNINALSQSTSSLSDVLLQYTQSANFGIRQ